MPKSHEWNCSKTSVSKKRMFIIIKSIEHFCDVFVYSIIHPFFTIWDNSVWQQIKKAHLPKQLQNVAYFSIFTSFNLYNNQIIQNLFYFIVLITWFFDILLILIKSFDSYHFIQITSLKCHLKIVVAILSTQKNCYENNANSKKFNFLI